MSEERLVTFEWEPATLALLEETGQHLTKKKVDRAVREWLKHILRHRQYLEKVKADPERRAMFIANRNVYQKRRRKLEKVAPAPMQPNVKKEDFVNRVVWFWGRCEGERPPANARS